MKFMKKTLEQLELIKRFLPNFNCKDHELTYTIEEVAEVCEYIESLITTIQIHAPDQLHKL